MKKLLLLLAAGTLGARLGVAQAINPVMESRPGRPIICPSRPENMNTQVAPPAAFLQQVGQRPNATGAVINVSYTGFSTQARLAFQYAVDIWKTQVNSSVPIQINANWSALGAGVLGSAAPNTFYSNFAGAV